MWGLTSIVVLVAAAAAAALAAPAAPALAGAEPEGRGEDGHEVEGEEGDHGGTHVDDVVRHV